MTDTKQKGRREKFWETAKKVHGWNAFHDFGVILSKGMTQTPFGKGYNVSEVRANLIDFLEPVIESLLQEERKKVLKSYGAWCPICFDACEVHGIKDKKGMTIAHQYRCYGCMKFFVLASPKELKSKYLP